ncbi:MAG: ABC transporter permease, partial [Gammaproteobacteria bacterium]|nr:ABC transporter permease [Gammaproteobacteria bacterium]
MTAYFIRRFLLIIPTFLGITILVFTVTRMVPGGPIERMLTEAQLASGDQVSFQNNNQGIAGSTLSESQLNQLKEYYGFDKPILESYGIWLKNILLLDLGYSTRYGEPVWESIKQRLPISIYYGVMTMLLTYMVC